MRAMHRLLLAAAFFGPIGFANAAEAPTEPPKPDTTRRDNFGDPLPTGAFRRLGSVAFRNGAGIFTIAYSPDGKRIASAGGTPWAQQGVSSGDRTIRVWDVENGKEVRSVNDFPHAIGCLAFSPSGKEIAACTLGDQSIRIWEIGSDKAPRVIQVNQNNAPTMTFAFAPDGKTLAVSRAGGKGPAGGYEIVLIDAETGKELRSFGTHSLTIDSLAFRKGGQLLASKSGPMVRLWDVARGERVRVFRPKNFHTKARFLALEMRQVPLFSTAAVTFSPDGGILAAEGGDNTLHLWDLDSGKELHALVHQGPVASASFSPDGKRLVTGGHDNVVRVWEVATGKELHRIADHFGGYALVAFSPDNKTFASSGGDHSIRFWDAESGKEIRARDAHHGELMTAFFHPHGKTATTIGRDNFVRTWDIETGRQLRAFADDRDTFDRVAFAPNGSLLATYSEDRESTRLWDLTEGKVQREFPGKALRLAFTADSQHLAIANAEDQLLLWDVKNGKPDKRFAEAMVSGGHFAFSANGKVLALVASDGSIQTWDVVTGKRTNQLQAERAGDAFVSFAVSHDGTYAAQLLRGGHAVLWDLSKGRVAFQLQKAGGVAFSNLTGSVAFSPDGRTLVVTGAGNSAAILWDVATGAERTSFTGHRGPLTFVAYSTDGRTVASGSWDTTVLLWDVYGLRDAAPRELTVQELDEAWKDLSGADTVKGFQATRKLAVAPRQALPLIARQLKPVVAVGKQELARMIRDLDSDKFDVRQKAFDDLERLSSLAEDDLRKTLAADLSLEVRRRVEQLLEKLREGPASPDSVRDGRALEVLEVIGTPEARALLQKLAGGAPAAPLTRAARHGLARTAPTAPIGR